MKFETWKATEARGKTWKPSVSLGTSASNKLRLLNTPLTFLAVQRKLRFRLTGAHSSLEKGKVYWI